MHTASMRRAPVGLLLTGGIVLGVLGLAFVLGQRPSPVLAGLLVAGLGAAAVLARPSLGLAAVVVFCLLLRFEIGTGTEVRLNLGSVLILGLLGLYVLTVLMGQMKLVWSPVLTPLAWFVVAGLLSLAVGQFTWDPSVPQRSNFWLVQMGQWTIFLIAVGAVWLMGAWVRSEAQLKQLVWLFLGIAGAVAILRVVPGLQSWVNAWTTIAFIRAPLWMLLTALAGGQLLFNERLGTGMRLFLVAGLFGSFAYAFGDNRESTSTWGGIVAAAGVLLWLRWPRLRVPLIVLAIGLEIVNVLFPFVWEFAGGDDDWFRTGGSRLALIERVISVTLRNPILGLGPAAYRPYANMQPLIYAHIVWYAPLVNSHNNYVDLFAHGGLVGLGLFFWFVWRAFQLGLDLHRRELTGFTAGFVNGMMAAGVGALVLMLFADWMLPFVYNIGYPGFQAAIPFWLFLGGLIAVARYTSVNGSTTDLDTRT